MVKNKTVLKVVMKCEKCQTKALQIAAQTPGVDSVGLEGEDSDTMKNKLVVIGDGVDIVAITKTLRKKVGNTEIISVSEIEEDT